MQSPSPSRSLPLTPRTPPSETVGTRVWQLVGVYSAIASITCWNLDFEPVSEKTEKKLIKETLILVSVLLAVLIGYGLVMLWAFSWRESPYMRRRVVRPNNAHINAIVTVIFSGIGCYHKADVPQIISWMCICVSVLCFEEVAKPSFDFGVLQVVVRLMITKTLLVAFDRKQENRFTMIGPVAILAIFINYWYPYSLKEYEKNFAKDKAEHDFYEAKRAFVSAKSAFDVADLIGVGAEDARGLLKKARTVLRQAKDESKRVDPDFVDSDGDTSSDDGSSAHETDTRLTRRNVAR